MRDMNSAIKRNLTIPNLLSFLRIIVIPPLMIFMLAEDYVMAGVMLLISAVSDMFDGMLARKLNQVTQLGKMLDPVADKLTLIAVVICIAVLYPAVLLFVIVLFLKEITMLCGGLVLIKMKIKPPAAKWFGKVATVIFYTSVISVILLKAIWKINNPVIILTLFSITTVSMLFALVKYIGVFIDLIKQKKNGSI